MHKQLVINIPQNAPPLKFNFGDRVVIEDSGEPQYWMQGTVSGLNLIDTDEVIQWLYHITVSSQWVSLNCYTEEKLYPFSALLNLQEDWLEQAKKNSKEASEILGD